MFPRTLKRVFNTNLKKFNKINFSSFSSSLHNKRDHENLKSKDSSKNWLTEQDQDFRVTTKTSHLQFSKAPILDNFGELQPGEIPEPLKYVRPFEMTTLPNGVRVCTERWETGTASVGVFVNAGSRNNNHENSGTAYFVERILLKGTKNK
jgi:hypothetical protein